MELKKEIKSKFSSNLEKAMVNITFTASWKRDNMIKVFAPFNILPQHFNVLRIVKGRDPKPITPSEIKAVLVEKNRDLTRLVDKLVKLGYLKRENRPENKRIIDITITENGKETLEKMNEALRAFFGKIKGITEEEAKTLSDLLDKLRDIQYE